MNHGRRCACDCPPQRGPGWQRAGTAVPERVNVGAYCIRPRREQGVLHTPTSRTGRMQYAPTTTRRQSAWFAMRLMIFQKLIAPKADVAEQGGTAVGPLGEPGGNRVATASPNAGQ